MNEIIISLCSWCGKVIKADGLPIGPGTYIAKVQVSHGMCEPCGVKMGIEIGASHHDTSAPYKGNEETR